MQGVGSVCAIIPARGGSKGVPGKNLRRVGGVPLVGRSVMAARAAVRVQRVFVSTDDPAIAEVAREHSAEVIARPAGLSGDTASSESALLHALDMLREAEGYRPSILIFLQCTSPFTQAGDIDAAVAAVADGGADTAFSAWSAHLFLWRRAADGGAVGVNHDKLRRLRRQEREPEFAENGAVYAMRREGFERHRHRFFGRTAVVEMPQLRSLEIDELADLGVADGLAPFCDAPWGHSTGGGHLAPIPRS
jgi:N-acylneuraminate cytidylyltransferase